VTAAVLSRRHEHEARIAWHLGALQRHERRGRQGAALVHLVRVVDLVRGRLEPVGGHAARVARGAAC